MCCVIGNQEIICFVYRENDRIGMCRNYGIMLKTEVSLCSAEVAGDSGVQGRKSSRSPEIADAVGRIPVGPNSVGFKPSSSSSCYCTCAQCAHIAEPPVYRLEEMLTQ